MAALLVVGGCQKQVLDPPSLKLDTNEFTAPASGGEVEVPYVLKNGTEGAEVSVDPVEDYTWVTGTRVESSSIYVTVTANDTEAERTAEFTVSYPGITKALEFSITQDAGETPAGDGDFVITVNNIEAESFTYSIVPADKEMTYFHMFFPKAAFAEYGYENIFVDGKLDGDALYAFDKEELYSQEGFFEMFTATGDLTDAEGASTSSTEMIVYCYGVNPGTQEKLTDVYYKEFTTLGLPAVITLDEELIEAGPDGYDGGVYFYRGGDFGEGEVTATTDVDWIELGVDQEENYISVKVAANDTPEPRTAAVTVSHPSVAEPAVLTVNQEAGTSSGGYDYDSKMDHFYMEFYEGEGYGGEDEYVVCISDISLASQDFEPGGTYYQFDIYVPAGSGTILTGNYPVGAPGETAAMTVSQDTGLTFYRYEGDPGVEAALVEGSLSVSAEGDIYTFDAVMTDEFGDVHHVSYTGSIEPEPAPEPIPGECDYEHEPAVCELEYDADYGDNGEDRYYLTFSDAPLDESGYPTPGHYSYSFDMYTESGSNGVLAPGTYTFTDDWMSTEAGVFTSMSDFIVMDESGNSEYLSYASGTIEVSVSGDTYTVEALLVDETAKTHHMTYVGPVEVSMDGILAEPLDFEATFGQAVYMDGNEELMAVELMLSNMAIEGSYLVPPGSLLTIEAYMPYDESGKLATGTYEVNDSYGPMTVAPGSDYYGIMDIGTYVDHCPDTETDDKGYIVSGTMEISGDPDSDQYTIKCDFVTDFGIPVTCTWSGSAYVYDIPEPAAPATTLEGDIMIDLEGTTPAAQYYGDYFGTGGGNWLISFRRPTGTTGDGFSIDLVAEGLDFAAGIPTGTYKAAADAVPVPGEYMPGYLDGYDIAPSGYVHYATEGYCDGYASAVSGDINITNNGDGTYDVSFACYDVDGNEMSGNWSGAIATSDVSSSGYSTSSVAGGKASAKVELHRVPANSVRIDGVKLNKVQPQVSHKADRKSAR